jgi:HlyD family secretion protein
MKKVIIIAGIAIVIIAVIAANFLKKEKGIEVDIEKVSRGDVIQSVNGSGQINPEVEVKVSANVAGKIMKLYADEGDSVKKGQLLVELDQEQYTAALERAQSNLLSMLATEKKLKSELIRANELREKGLLSDAEYEAAQASYEAAESNRKQAEAQVKEAKDMLSKTRLHADMDGLVTKLNKEAGEIALGAQFQEDVIMIVADLSRMEAVIEVDENDVVNVSLGDTAEVEIDAFVDTSFNGVVTKIANSATIKGLGTQEQVTNFEVKVSLIDYNERFRPGMSTTVDIITETRNDVLKVPIQCVTVRDKEKLEKAPDVEEKSTDESAEADKDKEEETVEVVFCIEDKKAIAKPVKLGISDDTHYEILSGLEEEETVVTGPFRILSRTLKNEDLVEVREKKKDKKNDD